jgi:hypothetical protein
MPAKHKSIIAGAIKKFNFLFMIFLIILNKSPYKGKQSVPTAVKLC